MLETNSISRLNSRRHTDPCLLCIYTSHALFSRHIMQPFPFVLLNVLHSCHSQPLSLYLRQHADDLYIYFSLRLQHMNDSVDT